MSMKSLKGAVHPIMLLLLPLVILHTHKMEVTSARNVLEGYHVITVLNCFTAVPL